MAVTARAAFDRQLHTLLDDTLLLGSMVEKAIERSIDALVRLDADLARQVIADDAQINAEAVQAGRGRGPSDRDAAADGRRPAPDRVGDPHLDRPGADRRLRGRHRQDRADARRPAAGQAADRHPTDGRDGPLDAAPQPRRAGPPRRRRLRERSSPRTTRSTPSTTRSTASC